MIPEAALKEISDIVGAEHLLDAAENLAEYGTDATKLEFMPDAVAFPGKSGRNLQNPSSRNRNRVSCCPEGSGEWHERWGPPCQRRPRNIYESP